MLQAVLARVAPEDGFGPSLSQGLGSSAWIPYCAGRYLQKVPGTWYCLWTFSVIALYPGGSAHSGSRGRHGSPSLISQSLEPGSMLLGLCHWEEAEDHVMAFRFSGTRLRFGNETVAE